MYLGYSSDSASRWYLVLMWRFWTFVLWLCSFLVVAEDKQPISLGMSAPFSGPAAQLGLSYRHGAELVFKQQNQQGGIAGRALQLVTLDDGY